MKIREGLWGWKTSYFSYVKAKTLRFTHSSCRGSGSTFEEGGVVLMDRFAVKNGLT
jgi:hypothetical protein